MDYFENSLGFGNSQLCTWSPNGFLLAVVSDKCRLVLRDAATLEVLKTEIISANDNTIINFISFSPDSQFILASDFKNGTSFVYRTTTDKESLTWKAKISEGVAGISDVKWSPDSRHIITMAEFNIKLTVWSLVQKLVRYIKFPKRKECVAFCPNGSYLAVVERRDNKDFLNLFSCLTDWGSAKNWELYPELDTLGLSWSPKSHLMAVYSSKLQCIVCIYGLDGRCLFIYKPNEIGISLASVKWSRCGNILAVATSQYISIINTLTWAVISDLDIPVKLHDSNVRLFIEMEKPLTTNDVDVRIARELCRNPLDSEYVPVCDRPVDLLPAKRSKRIPLVEMEFSTDNNFLVAKSSSDHILWIWEVSKLRLHSILIHQKPIQSIQWSPRCEKVCSLLILTSDGLLHVSSSLGAICLSLPPLDKDYGKIKGVQWNPLGRALALTCEDGIVCCRVGLKT